MDSMGFDSSGCFKDRFSFLPIVESVHTTVLGFGVPSGFLSFPVRCARSIAGGDSICNFSVNTSFTLTSVLFQLSELLNPLQCLQYGHYFYGFDFRGKLLSRAASRQGLRLSDLLNRRSV